MPLSFHLHLKHTQKNVQEVLTMIFFCQQRKISMYNFQSQFYMFEREQGGGRRRKKRENHIKKIKIFLS